MLCITVIVNRHFGGTYSLHLPVEEQALPASCWFIYKNILSTKPNNAVQIRKWLLSSLQSGRYEYLPTFRGNFLPLFLGQESQPSVPLFHARPTLLSWRRRQKVPPKRRYIYKTTRCHIPEGSNLRSHAVTISNSTDKVILKSHDTH
jgi:hypothetical protein